MYIKNVRYQSNLYIFIFSAMLSWTTHLKPDSELPKELLSVDALLNIVDVSIKVLDENVNLTRIKKYFSKEAWNHLKDIISTEKENAVYDCCVCQTDLHSEDCVACDVSQLIPSKMYWTTFCAEKNLLVLPKLLEITLNINLIHCLT